MSLDATRWAWMQQGLRPIHKLVLLSLADRAGADDTSWPSQQQLVADTGADRKSIQGAITALVAAGLIADTGDRKGATKQIVVYRMLCVDHREEAQKRNSTENGTVPFFPPKEPENGLGKEPKNGLRNLPEESTKNRTSRAQAREAIPFDRIVELFHEHLPMLPRVVALTDKRRKSIAARWADGMPSLDVWEAYFVAVSESDFLCGRTPRSSWRADIDFLTKPDTPIRVEEGKYANQKIR